MSDENVVKLVNKRRDRILVVEDEADARELMEGDVCTQAGYSVDVAEDGFVALDKLARLVAGSDAHGHAYAWHARCRADPQGEQIRDDVPAVLTTGPKLGPRDRGRGIWRGRRAGSSRSPGGFPLWTIECALGCRVGGTASRSGCARRKNVPIYDYLRGHAGHRRTGMSSPHQTGGGRRFARGAGAVPGAAAGGCRA